MSDQTGKLPIDPEYPSGSGLSSGRTAAIGTLGSAAAQLVPLVGPAVQELIKACIADPLEVRRAAWFTKLGEGLHDLQVKLGNFDPSRLRENEDFISAVVVTTQMAMRTSKEEKREALCNAVLNLATGFSYNEVVHGSFLNLIDRFSSGHIHVLRIYQQPSLLRPVLPSEQNAQISGPIKQFIEQLLMQQGTSKAAANKIQADLEREDMIETYQLSGSPDNYKSMLKPIGEDFLNFISNPTS